MITKMNQMLMIQAWSPYSDVLYVYILLLFIIMTYIILMYNDLTYVYLHIFL